MSATRIMMASAAAMLVVVASSSLASSTRSSEESLPAGLDKKCAVKVDRTQEAGTYDVTRQVLENGDCICYVYTGAKPQSDTIERAIADLQERRECRDAKVMIVPPAAGAAAAAAGGTGFLPVLGVGPLLGVTGAGAAAAAGLAASGTSPDSP